MPEPKKILKVVALSDTHNYQIDSVPDGDILIHAGDFTNKGTLAEIGKFNYWFMQLPHRHKLVVAGNHDLSFDSPDRLLARNMFDSSITYLENDSVIIDGIKFYGSPVTPTFCDWGFNVDEDSALMTDIWDRIPEDTNVLITHGPAYGILDYLCQENLNIGSKKLLERIKKLTELHTHVFGHLHSCYGTKYVNSITSSTDFHTYHAINAALCNENYLIANEPIVFYLQNKN